jgi:glutathionyl-hydroquinone reductase
VGPADENKRWRWRAAAPSRSGLPAAAGVTREPRALGAQTGGEAVHGCTDAAARDLFAALDVLDEHLSGRHCLAGERLSEADLRLFPTLIRFDVAYYGALRCNLRRLVDYPNLWAYTRRLYHLPGIAETVRLDHLKRHYWDDHAMINRKIVPLGPVVDLGAAAAA